VRVIKKKTLSEYWEKHPDSRSGLELWLAAAEAAEWKNLMEVRKTFGHADAVKVESGRTVTVFNIAGNKYRLLTGIHYKSKIVFTLSVLTHAEYSKGDWRSVL